MNYPDNQTEVFLQSEADSWFERNFSQHVKKDREHDLALQFLLKQDLTNKSVVELGCADGWRLADLNKEFDCSCIGIEPSTKAVEVGQERYGEEIRLLTGTAADTGLENNSADIVIAGFCLYLCDRSELFKIAYEIDRILKEGGLLLIVDFLPPFAYKNPYHHKEGLSSYKMDYSQMFVWNPEYTMMCLEVADLTNHIAGDNSPDTRVGLTVLKKSLEFSYPESPFKG
jgi:ubiquinone/menaquinone biosynthesis C-methylase UbiE